MTVREYLSNSSSPLELAQKLLKIDVGILKLHAMKYYMAMQITDVEVFPNDKEGLIKIPESFHGRLYHKGEGIRPDDGENDDIIQLCVLGVCAYKPLTIRYINRDYVQMIVDDFNKKDENGNIVEPTFVNQMPDMLKDYYTGVFRYGDLGLLTDFYVKNYYKYDDEFNIDRTGNNVSKANGKTKVYCTAAGKYMSESDSAFASILLLPALLALIYILAVVVYFIFIK